METYSRGWRGAPAKGVDRETGARVQISLSPPFLSINSNCVWVFILQYSCKQYINKLKYNYNNSIIWLRGREYIWKIKRIILYYLVWLEY